MYVIITDSRKRDEILFLVDRSRQRASFWSNRIDDVMRFSDKSAAIKRASALRFNNPRVITLRDAMIIVKEREFSAMVAQASLDAELGWDAHKSY